MAYRSFDFALVVSLLAVPACFNPDGGNLDTDSDGDTGQTSEPTGVMTSMTMTGSDPTGDSTSNVDTTADDDDDDDDSTGDPECQGDGDCADMAGECEVATCGSDGMCEVGNAPEGTACGDTTDAECNGADTCDGNGTCVDNVLADGLDCSDCDSGQCICGAGTCDDCIAFADTNLFSTQRSLNGWELTGDWGLYTQAPASRSQLDGMLSPAIPFGNQVLGTDGNRHDPYPGGHMEFSYARTPPTELPTSLEFQSWHLDEGAGTFDNKTIRISTDGGKTWTDIISCVLDPLLPFCASVNTRTADDWDSISLDLPAPLVGQEGIIEFAYDTFDGCCDFEKGWYIDVTNFATECACTADATCAAYGTECGEGVCGANGGCNLDPMPAGTACGDGDMNACTAPDQCDAFGACQDNDNYPPYGPGGPETQVLPCGMCPAGDDCVGCAAGECQDCANLPDTESFDSMPFAPSLSSTFNWQFQAMSGGNWGVFFSIPNNEQNEGFLASMGAPFLGIDGSTVGAADGTGETNNALTTTRPDVFGETLEFRSWNQDEGGGGGGADTKRIEITVDNGMTWIPVADCSQPGALSAFPFCNSVDDRDPEDWDDISIDISDYADQEGQIRFAYNTFDSCCGFERGWFIDDLNFAQLCDAPNPSVLFADCTAWVSEETCTQNQDCAWDGAACITCSNLPQAMCEAEPLCEWRVGEDGSTRCTQSL